MSTRKPTTHNYKYGSVFPRSLPQPARSTSQQLEEKKKQGFITILIENKLKFISLLRRKYFT